MGTTIMLHNIPEERRPDLLHGEIWNHELSSLISLNVYPLQLSSKDADVHFFKQWL